MQGYSFDLKIFGQGRRRCVGGDGEIGKEKEKRERKEKV